MNNKILLGVLVAVMITGTFIVMTRRNKPDTLTSLEKRYIQKEGDYSIYFTENTKGLLPESSHVLHFKIKDPDGQILKNFDVVHEKLLHFIVIRHDLQHFQHLHPEFDPETGEFTIGVQFPTHGPYRLIAEFTPPKFEGNPNSVALTAVQDVEVGNMSKYRAANITVDKNNVKKAGDYAITYNFPDKVRAGENFTYSLSIRKNGSAVAHMGEYLGALAHAIILKSDTLAMTHLHSDDHAGHDMESHEAANSGPEINITAKIQETGVYKVYTEFEHEGQVVVSNHVFQVE